MDINHQAFISTARAKQQQFQAQLQYDWRKLSENSLPQDEPVIRAQTHQAVNQLKQQLRQIKHTDDSQWSELSEEITQLIQQIEPKFY